MDTDGHTYGIAGINGTNITETWSGPKPFLLFETIGALEHDWVQVYVRPTDQLEKKSSPAVWVRLTDPTSEFETRKLHSVDIDEEPGTVVTIDIVISRGLQFEFHVAPPELPKVRLIHIQQQPKKAASDTSSSKSYQTWNLAVVGLVADSKSSPAELDGSSEHVYTIVPAERICDAVNRFQNQRKVR